MIRRIAIIASLLTCFCVSGINLLQADSSLYANWEYILKTCVKEGKVDIKELIDNEHMLLSFLVQLGSISKQEFDSWSEGERLCFLINTYNACSLRLILYSPYKDVLTKLKYGPNDEIFNLLGGKCSLNIIKHMYIRGLFHEARVHFALSSLAKGFPTLRAEAYTAEYLDFFLEDDVMRFISDPSNVRYDGNEKKLVLNPIFKWFAEDFVHMYDRDIETLDVFPLQERAVIYFLSKYMSDMELTLRKGDYTIVYNDFDWRIHKIKIEASIPKPLGKEK